MSRPSRALRPFPASLLLIAGVLIAGVVAGQLALAGETRTWTDKTGKFRIEAEFVAEDDGVVTLRKEDGDEIEVPLEKLSAADRRSFVTDPQAGGAGCG